MIDILITIFNFIVIIVVIAVIVIAVAVAVITVEPVAVAVVDAASMYPSTENDRDFGIVFPQQRFRRIDAQMDER